MGIAVGQGRHIAKLGRAAAHLLVTSGKYPTCLIMKASALYANSRMLPRSYNLAPFSPRASPSGHGPSAPAYAPHQCTLSLAAHIATLASGGGRTSCEILLGERSRDVLSRGARYQGHPTATARHDGQRHLHVGVPAWHWPSEDAQHSVGRCTPPVDGALRHGNRPWVQALRLIRRHCLQPLCLQNLHRPAISV